MADPQPWYETIFSSSIGMMIGGALVQAFHSIMSRRGMSQDRFHSDLFQAWQTLQNKLETERRECDDKIDKLRDLSERQHLAYLTQIERLQQSNDELRQQLATYFKPHFGD